MNKAIQTAVLGLLFSCFFAFAANAQQKIGYVDSEKVLQLMPEYQRAKSEVEAYGRQLEKQLKAKENSLAAYYQEVMAMAPEMTQAQQEEAEKKLMKMQEDLQKAANLADENLAKKEAELTKPMYEKFETALKTMAKAEGFAYVVDKKLLMYSEGGIDATEKLKAQLGLK